MSELPPFLKRLPDGRILDTRLKYKPGTKVCITAGPYKGHTATVDTGVGMIKEDGSWIVEHGYNAKLEDGSWTTIRWDWVERV